MDYRYAEAAAAQTASGVGYAMCDIGRASTSVSPAPPALEHIAERVNEAIKRLHNVNGDLSEIAMRVFGASPSSEGSATGSRPQADGQIGMLNAMLDALHDSVLSVDTAAGRFRRL